MNTVEIDEWLTHLQTEVESVGDQLHQLITALIVIGALALAVAAGVAVAVYLY
jgi:hypothetical protein